MRLLLMFFFAGTHSFSLLGGGTGAMSLSSTELRKEKHKTTGTQHRIGDVDGGQSPGITHVTLTPSIALLGTQRKNSEVQGVT